MTQWQPGDLALCIKLSVWRSRSSDAVGRGPSAGQILTVARVGDMRSGLTGLVFADYHSDVDMAGHPVPYASDRFVRLEPHVPDADDADVATGRALR